MAVYQRMLNVVILKIIKVIVMMLLFQIQIKNVNMTAVKQKTNAMQYLKNAAIFIMNKNVIAINLKMN